MENTPKYVIYSPLSLPKTQNETKNKKEQTIIQEKTNINSIHECKPCVQNSEQKTIKKIDQSKENNQYSLRYK